MTKIITQDPVHPELECLTDIIPTFSDYNFLCQEDDMGRGCVSIIKKDGMAIINLFQASSDVTTSILIGLSVMPNVRAMGEGTRLMQIAEIISYRLGMERICLFCKKDTWHKDWYARLGYEYNSEYNEKNIWMEKNL